MRDYEKDNTVAADNQLPRENRLTAARAGAEYRVLFVGNSITRHGPKADIGWPYDWGMAASSQEADYVHLFMQMLGCVVPGASHRIAQASAWELGFWKGREVLREFEGALQPKNDLVIVRLGENILESDMRAHPLLPAFVEMLEFFGTGGAQVIVTDLFWPNPAKDEAITQAARALNLPLVPLNDLGKSDDMKAIGLFEHAGVSAHPGDRGMRAIARRIFERALPYLPE